PVLVQVDAVPAAGDEPRLDRQHQAGHEARAASRLAAVGNVRVLVHGPADAVAAEVGGDAVPARLADLADGGGDVAELAAGPGRGDARRERRLRGGDQPRVRVRGRAHAEGDGRVADPAVKRGAGVHAEQVAVPQPVVVRYAVQRGVVHRRA